jgi:hypothetical protein
MMSNLRALEIFDGYPDGDLIPLPEPMTNESVSTYLKWIPNAHQHFGDTLFQFVLFELRDCDRSTACARLQRAIADLKSLKESLIEAEEGS